MSSTKRIGILTSGGDCSGLNSVIRASLKRANILGYEFIGIKRGVRGLASVPSDYITLNETICDESMLTNSGSLIYSDTKWFNSDTNISLEKIKKIIYAGYKTLNLSGLIYVGGDGSLHLLNELLMDNNDMNLVAIPKTIDNDVGFTDYSVGFQTVVDVVCSAIENVRSTAKSHERALVVEVMGRNAGYIAMYAGIASGADAILVPEFGYDIQSLKAQIQKCYDSGQNHAIIIVSEAVESENFKHKKENVNGVVKYSKSKYQGIGDHIANQLKSFGFDSRAVVLGHIQRGGKTVINDRIIGSAFGVEAVNLIDSNDCGKLIGFVNGKISSIKIKDVISNITKHLSKNDICVNIAKNLGVYIGNV